MAERWLEVKLNFIDVQLANQAWGNDDPAFAAIYRRMVLDFLKPLVDFGEQKGDLESYHFFFEPDPHVLVRLKLRGDADPSALEVRAKELFASVNDFLASMGFGLEYTGEAAQYGDDGWHVAQDLFRVAADIAMLRADDTREHGPEFNMGKLIHTICNPVLGNYLSEHHFYLQRLLDLQTIFVRNPGVVHGGKTQAGPAYLIPKR